MAAIDYAGLNHDLYFRDKTGEKLQASPRCERPGLRQHFKDEVTRDFIVAVNLQTIKSIDHQI